jgi:hypothetical protein
VLVKRLRIPIYLTRMTAPAIAWNDAAPRLGTFQAGCRFSIGDIEIDSFTIPHGADPVTFAPRREDRRGHRSGPHPHRQVSSAWDGPAGPQSIGLVLQVGPYPGR